MLLLLLACAGPASPKVGDDSATPAGDSTPTVGDDSGGTSGDDTGGTPTGGLAWTLSEEVQSLGTVGWTQAEAAETWVAWTFGDGESGQSPRRTRAAGAQSELVLGLPYATTAALTVWADAGAGPYAVGTRTVETGPLPAGLPIPAVWVDDPTRQEPTGRWLLGSINQDEGGWDEGRYWMWIVDRAGRVVWAKRGEDRDFTIYLRVSKDGDILWDVSTWWSLFDEGAASRIHRMKIDGVVTETIDAPGMHHAFVELPDGAIAWGSGGDDSERLLRRDPDGTVTTLWDCAPFYAELGLSDWCHTNSIVHLPDTGGWLLSFPTNRTFVLELDAAGEEVRWFGHVPGSWTFDPPESAFQYQHGVTYTDTGTLLVSTQESARSIDGMVREYALDEASGTLEQVWSYGEGSGIEQRYAGEAHRLPGGNTLHNFGTTPRVQEITPDGALAWDLAFDGYRLIGRTVFLEDLYTLAP